MKLLFVCFAAFCSLHLVKAKDEGTLCGLPRCTNLLNPFDGCGDGCDDACDSDSECASDGAGRGGCASNEHCVTARYDEEVKGEDFCDCLVEGFLDCFSSVSTVEVENKGTTLIKDIKVGEKVLTGSNEYKPVYTVDHQNPRKPTNFVQIHSTGNDSPLEMTASHLIYIHGQQDPIPASAVEVGHELQTVNGFPSIVTKISTIKRIGLWNPITTDGTIVVDGVVASTYNVPFKHNNNEGAYVEVGGLNLVSHHNFLHLLMAPYRAMCLGLSVSFCETKNEYNVYSWIGMSIMKFYYQQKDVVQDMMVFGLLAVFKLLELAMNPLVGVAVLPGIYYFLMSKIKK
jgi:hypothetical protein